MKTKKNILYYILLLFIGYFIYRFQIEKSFNLLSIYTLSVSFSFFCFLFNFDSKKSLPLLFVLSLFSMYGINYQVAEYQLQWSSFIILLASMALMLFVLLSNYRLALKKATVLFLGILLASVYFIKSGILVDYKFVPYVIGTFFMFRSISFLHEIKFMKKEVPLLDKVNYFLLTPNFSMPLFPIPDYKTYVTSYEGITTNTLSRACLFICRGLFQMILYRFIYHHIIIPFDEIQSASQLIVFLIANFLVVLRVIGAFHIAIGLIILSGYNIPDIFNNIFFSTGFSDLWRRTNMYWRTFILKIFYYPLYFRLKKYGVYFALTSSIIICFFITWILHAYQWFWLKGTFPIELKDIFFWGGFGLLVSANTVYQQKMLDKSYIKKKETGLSYITNAIYAWGVLLTMSFLWSIWTAESLQSWFMLIRKIEFFQFHDLKIIILIFLAYSLIISIFHLYQKGSSQIFQAINKNKRIIACSAFVLFFLFIQSMEMITKNKRSHIYWTIVYPLIAEQLNQNDLNKLDNGYYSNLISTNNYCSQVWINETDNDRNLTKYIKSKTSVLSYDLMHTRNVPFASANYNNITYNLNSYGLRDKEYPITKPDSCYRIIVLGGSYECGNGMNDGEDFISLVEDNLNNKYWATIDGVKKHIELINFSSHGYYLLQRMYEYKDRASHWNPDGVLLFLHTNYAERITTYINIMLDPKYKIADPYLNMVINKLHLQDSDDLQTTRKKLGSYADSVNYYAIEKIKEISLSQNKAVLVPVYLPALKDQVTDRDSIFVADICDRYNLKPIILSDVYDDEDANNLSISDIDFHPNKKANGIISDKLLENIISHQSYFNIKFTKK